MAKRINAVVKEPRDTAFECDVLNRLDAFQRLVDGYIETVRLPIGGKTVIMICNEEGKIGNYDFNFELNFGNVGDTIFGTVVFVGEDGDEFADCPVSAEEVEDWINEMQ